MTFDRPAFDPAQAVALARKTFEIEAAAVLGMGERIGPEFADAVQAILRCSGRVVVMGMGKSGHVGRKITATLASTGTPAMFVHPAEASHGDLGMIRPDDVILALSWSGETAELAEATDPNLILNLKAKLDAQGQLSGIGYAESSPLDRGPSLVPGHWGAQVVEELSVAAADITVFKHRLSGFYDNELDSLLRQQGLKTLLFAGINTDRCVFSSLQDAGFLGYDCVLLEDACATPSPAYVSRAILFLVEKLHGFVASAQALTVSLTPKGARS
jgi:nicotinamidase-related amidase